MKIVMNVRAVDFARLSDRERLKQIWAACFGGPKEYVNFYYHRRFRPRETLVWREDGRPVAMMTLMPVEIRGRKGAYVYAVATLPEYRHKGLMVRLDEAAKQVVLQQGGCFTILVPAGQSLFAMYEKLGYQTSCFLWEGEAAAEAEASPLQMTPCGFREFSRLRQAYLAGFPQAAAYPEKDLRYIFNELTGFSGGAAVYWEEGRKQYAAYTMLEDGRIWLRECSGQDPAAAAQALLRRFRRSRALIFSSRPFSGGVPTPYGMGRALSPEGEVCLENLYMSLMLD